MRKINRQSCLTPILASALEESMGNVVDDIDTGGKKNLFKEDDVKSLAIVRSHKLSNVKTTICDLVRYAHLTFVGSPKTLDPIVADKILVHVIKCQLKVRSEAASIISLTDEAPVAIGRLRKIHPPAHVIIISPRYDIFHELVEYIDTLPDIDITLEFDPVYACEEDSEKVAWQV